MVKKMLVLLGLLVFLAGCETTKGAGAAAGGIAQDVKTGWAKVEQFDQWLRENYW